MTNPNPAEFHTGDCTTCGFGYTGTTPAEAIDNHDAAQAHEFAGEPGIRTRDEYNAEVLEQAITCQAENGTLEPDEELNAQIAYVRANLGTEAVDHAVDHLRGMLTISYLDESDLPDAPEARGAAPVFPVGHPMEMIDLEPIRMTRAQIDAIYPALEAVLEYGTNRAENRAMEILMGAIPTSFFETDTRPVDESGSAKIAKAVEDLGLPY